MSIVGRVKRALVNMSLNVGGDFVPRLTIVLTKENEQYLRSQLRRQGDISRIINELLDKARFDIANNVTVQATVQPSATS